MVLDVSAAVLEATVPFGHISDQQMLDQTLRVFVKIARELNLALQDFLVDCHRVIIVEGINTGVHFVDENTEGPPVNGLSVTLVQQHLRSKILGSTTECVGTSFAVFGKTEIGKLQVAFIIDENVLWLEITVDDVLRVKVLEHECNLGAIKHSMLSVKLSFSSQIGKQLTASNVLHQEIQVAAVLGESLQAHQKWMVNVSENSILRDAVINLAQLDDIGLLETFHGEVFTCLLVLGQHDSSE